jgi:hypothetical protein
VGEMELKMIDYIDCAIDTLSKFDKANESDNVLKDNNVYYTTGYYSDNKMEDVLAFTLFSDNAILLRDTIAKIIEEGVGCIAYIDENISTFLKNQFDENVENSEIDFSNILFNNPVMIYITDFHMYVEMDKYDKDLSERIKSNMIEDYDLEVVK